MGERKTWDEWKCPFLNEHTCFISGVLFLGEKEFAEISSERENSTGQAGGILTEGVGPVSLSSSERENSTGQAGGIRVRLLKVER